MINPMIVGGDCLKVRAKVLVSACLLGENVRYHGGSAHIDSPIMDRWRSEGRLVSSCPEVSGGLGSPRPPAELTNGDGQQVLARAALVITKAGTDVTAAFRTGAEQAVALVRQFDIRIAVLKSRSPSCGTGQIYDGSFSGRLVPGDGVTAAALRREGVRVFDELQLAEADEALQAIERRAIHDE